MISWTEVSSTVKSQSLAQSGEDSNVIPGRSSQWSNLFSPRQVTARAAIWFRCIMDSESCPSATKDQSLIYDLMGMTCICLDSGHIVTLQKHGQPISPCKPNIKGLVAGFGGDEGGDVRSGIPWICK